MGMRLGYSIQGEEGGPTGWGAPWRVCEDRRGGWEGAFWGSEGRGFCQL